jgi:hypothetical protein
MPHCVVAPDELIADLALISNTVPHEHLLR